MDIGYARVSTGEQSVASQRAAVESKATIDRWYVDEAISGSQPADQREGFQALLDHARPGDTIHVVRLDRLSRSLGDLLRTVERLGDHGIALVSHGEGMDINPTTPQGKLTLSLFGALSEFERGLLRQRVQEGVAAAKARGVHCGRPRALDEQRSLDLGRAMLDRGEQSVAEIAQRFGVSAATAYRARAAYLESRGTVLA